MFKTWSIRNLLQLWSFATIFAILVIAFVAIYSNQFFSDTQNDLTDSVLPMEDASRQISAVSFSFITRQKQVIASESLEAINELTPRLTLEGEFSKQWLRVANSVKNNEQGQEVVNSLLEKYQQFLETDNQLLLLIRQQHALRSQLKEKTNNVQSIERKIQNQVEAISGKINLQVSRSKRDIRLNQNGQILPKSNLLGDQYAIQKLSQSVRLNTLNISYLTQSLLQSGSTDDLLSIRENAIRQHESILKTDINQLMNKLQFDNDLRVITKSLEHDISELIRTVIDDELSIYHLRLKQLQNKQLLIEGQKNSIATLKLITARLNQLSTLVSNQSLMTVGKSVLVAEKARWLIILLSFLITLGMIRFIISISERINMPLAELRSAMHALSSEEFDTRLKVTEGKSEFAVLAGDFNLFAENTQNLISDLAEAKNTLQAKEYQIRATLNGVPDAILTLSSSGIIQSVNPATERVLKVNDTTLIGLGITQFFDESQEISTLSDIENMLSESNEFEGRDYHKNRFSMRLSLNAISNQKNGLWVCVISDITAWKQTNKALKKTSSELDTILENAMVGIAFVKDRVIQKVNHKFETLFGYDRNTIEGQSAQQLYLNEAVFSDIGEQAYRVLSTGESFEGEVQLVKQSGETFWCSLSSKAIASGRAQEGSIWLFEDITSQREKDEKLLMLANLDSLTGLLNRGIFNDRLEHALHKAHRNSTRLAVFFLDLDHFKHINDSLGHKAGDILLCEVAKRLKQCVREGDTVARFGGDEFTIILEEVRSAQYVGKVADKILETVAESYMLETTEVNISPSVGISLYPADGRDVDLLLKNADAAMYHAKNNGRNNFQFYSTDMNALATQRLELETALRRAVENNEFYLHFQPQINLATGMISGAEALLRWNSQQWGNVSPAEFVPILEDTGLINEVGSIVLQQAVAAYLALKDKLIPEFQIAVNLSGRQFQGGQLAAFVRNLLIDTGMQAENLELEITETVLMDDKDLAITTLNELSDLGITLAIDDFGTGYSSLSYLKLFPLNVLKIDRSFVRDVTIDADDAAIVDAILAMSRRLKLNVVAEGVETKEQLDFLQANGCERVQGYYFSKPLDFEAFSAFVEKGDVYP